jgi:hypothetical protein
MPGPYIHPPTDGTNPNQARQKLVEAIFRASSKAPRQAKPSQLGGMSISNRMKSPWIAPKRNAPKPTKY